MANEYVAWLEDLGSGDVGRVGGKNASLGEMIRNLEEQGVRDFHARVARLTRELGVRLVVDTSAAVLRFAGREQSQSEHPMAGGVVRWAKERGLAVKPVRDFRNLPGRGARELSRGAGRQGGRKVEGATKFAAAGHSAAIGRLEDALAILRCDAGTRIDGAGSAIEIRR